MNGDGGGGGGGGAGGGALTLMFFATGRGPGSNSGRCGGGGGLDLILFATGRARSSRGGCTAPTTVRFDHSLSHEIGSSFSITNLRGTKGGFGGHDDAWRFARTGDHCVVRQWCQRWKIHVVFVRSRLNVKLDRTFNVQRLD